MCRLQCFCIVVRTLHCPCDCQICVHEFVSLHFVSQRYVCYIIIMYTVIVCSVVFLHSAHIPSLVPGTWSYGILGLRIPHEPPPPVLLTQHSCRHSCTLQHNITADSAFLCQSVLKDLIVSSLYLSTASLYFATV